MIKIPAVRSKSEIAGPSLCPIPLAVVIARCCCPVEGEANDNFSGLGQTGWSSRKTESRLKAGNATLGMSRLHWIEKIVGLRLIIRIKVIGIKLGALEKVNKFSLFQSK